MKPRHDIRNRVRRHRLLAGEMTQQELADRVGVTRQTIVSIEKGRYNPSVGLALRLAATFEVAVEELFELQKGEGEC
jgi:putative transcriptional regulator